MIKPPIKPLITMAEVAAVLKCTPTTVKNYRRQGRLKATLIGGRYYITEAALRRITEKGLPPTSAAYRQKAKLDKRAKRAAAKASSPKGSRKG